METNAIMCMNFFHYLTASSSVVEFGTISFSNSLSNGRHQATIDLIFSDFNYI